MNDISTDICYFLLLSEPLFQGRLSGNRYNEINMSKICNSKIPAFSPAIVKQLQ